MDYSVADRQIQTLISVLRRFDDEYTRIKRSLNVLDFADLEHQTLAMFDAQPMVADKLRQRFAHVFVDEYQDINDIQQRLLQAVSRRTIYLLSAMSSRVSTRFARAVRRFPGAVIRCDRRCKTFGYRVACDMNDNFPLTAGDSRFCQPDIWQDDDTIHGGSGLYERAELIAGLDYPPLSAIRRQAARR